MRPTLSQCFPNPLTRQWPATTNPVSCECHQLYALVCLCCCLPRTHLLVLHEGESNNMVTSMPKGPKYVDFRISPRTTAEDLSSFLQRAEAASANTGGAGRDDMPSIALTQYQAPPSPQAAALGADSPYTPASTRNSDAAAARSGGGSSVLWRGPGRAAPRRHAVVVCLHGTAVASPAVQSVLMDVLVYGQVAGHRGAREVPSLRIVAFCDHRACAAVLPEPMRAAFALSTFMSAPAMDSAVVLQSTDSAGSSVVNKAYMREVTGSADGAGLIDTVVLSSAVARYLRHLLLTVRGSAVAELAPGAMLIRRVPYLCRLLKAAALLFMPPDETFVRRRPNPRGAGGTRYHSQVGSTVVASQHGFGGGGALGGGGDGDDIPFACNKDDSGRILSFSHVFVSPSDVICLLPALVSHTLTLHRSAVGMASRVAACREALLAPGAQLLVQASGRQDYGSPSGTDGSPTGGGAMNWLPPPPGLWDARIASLALARRSYAPFVDATAAAATHSRRQQQQLFTGAGSDHHHQQQQVAGGNQSVGNDGSFAAAAGSRMALGASFVSEAWRAGDGGLLLELPADDPSVAYKAFLSYAEARDLVRATLVCRSHPAPA